MRKRTFLKTSSALFAGSFFTPILSCTSNEKHKSSPVRRTNWAGNLVYQAENYHESTTLNDIQQLIKENKKVKALGTRHCFNNLADSRYNHISIRSLNKVVNLDETNQTVTVESGINYGQLCPWLHEQGYAIHNLASLPHISIAGACATATHGSGRQNGNLATAVNKIEFINGNGDLTVLSREKDTEQFNGAIIHLGGIGILTELTLDIQPAFQMRQNVYQNLPVTELTSHFDEVMSAGYSVSLFTDWQTDFVNQVWVKSKIEDSGNVAAKNLFGAKLFDRKVHPILDHSPEKCTEQMGESGAWCDRLPHFKMQFMPSSGKELQSEYFVPFRFATEAYRAIESLREKVGPLLMISEVRSIAADDFWMSPALGQDVIAFHFTWEQDWKKLRKLLPILESKLKPFEARPHWGKMFTMSSEHLQSLYPKLKDFKLLLDKFDPEMKFVNDYLHQHLLA